MMPGRFWGALTVFVLGIVCACEGLAASTPCPDRGFEFFEEQGYVVRKVAITGFLPLSRSLSNFTELEGRPFSKATTERVRSDLRESLKRTRSLFDSLVSISATGVRVANCAATGSPKELDIEYLVFTTKVPLVSIHTIEHKDLEKAHPAEALALSRTKNRFRITPILGYDTSQKLRFGGQLDGQTPSANTRLQFGAEVSTNSANVVAAMSGNREFDDGFFRKLTWRTAFEYDKLPSDLTPLESGQALAQFSFLTKPIGRVGAVFRGGTLFEVGSQRTALGQQSLPPDLLAGSSFANWKSYAGFSIRYARQSLAGSYGLILGHTRGLVDYRKQIVDVIYDARWLVAPHRPLEMNARFTAGFLAKIGLTPVSEQFFGGNVETPFMPGSEWVIRANPVMRGIPAYHLNRTLQEAVPGTDQFSVLNLTLAFPVWGIPLIPDEATQDPEIREKVQGFVKDGADGLVPVFELDDPAQKELFRTLREPFSKTTADIETRLEEIKKATIPPALQDRYDVCAEKAGDLAADASSITKNTPWRNFIKNDPDERGIPVILKVCLTDLNGELKDAELIRLGEELKEHQRVIEQQVAKIDTIKARQTAVETLEFPKLVLNTVFDEMTIVSFSPVAVVDIGRIGPAAAGQRSMRYSLGGGGRLTLASSVSLQVGYAWNVHPQPWEGRGALFVGLQFIDLFGR